jgi:hypothetical protein
MHKIKFIKLIIPLIFLSFCPYQIVSQVIDLDAPYRGGVGDGFGFTNSSVFNFSEIDFAGTNVTVTIDQASSQNDPAYSEPVIYTVIFSENVSNFDNSDILFVGSVIPQNVSVSGTGNTFKIELSGIDSNGELILQIASDAAYNSVGNPNQKSTSTDNSVTFVGAPLNVSINLADEQKYYTNDSIVNFSVIFSENVNDFTYEDLTLSGSANPKKIIISGSGSIYNAAITGMTDNGNVIIDLPENKVHSIVGLGNSASNNIGNQIITDYSLPSVEITQEIGQLDPALTLPLNFHIEFTEDVENFGSDKVSFGGSSGVYLQITGMGKNYTVSVFGVKSSETIRISVEANAVCDIAGNSNLPSVNTDNEITYAGTTSLEGIDKNAECLFYCYEGEIHVNFTNSPNRNNEVHIYDVMGRLVLNKKSLSRNNHFSVNPSNSFYLIKVKNGNAIYSKILLIN